jgi:hypothetical protein
MRFKSRLVKEEIERAADSEDKEVSLCVMALIFVNRAQPLLIGKCAAYAV